MNHYKRCKSCGESRIDITEDIENTIYNVWCHGCIFNNRGGDRILVKCVRCRGWMPVIKINNVYNKLCCFCS